MIYSQEKTANNDYCRDETIAETAQTPLNFLDEMTNASFLGQHEALIPFRAPSEGFAAMVAKSLGQRPDALIVFGFFVTAKTVHTPSLRIPGTFEHRRRLHWFNSCLWLSVSPPSGISESHRFFRSQSGPHPSRGLGAHPCLQFIMELYRHYVLFRLLDGTSCVLVVTNALIVVVRLHLPERGEGGGV